MIWVQILTLGLQIGIAIHCVYLVIMINRDRKALRSSLLKNRELEFHVRRRSAELGAVVEVARNINRLLNELDSVTQHGYAHEKLNEAIVAFDKQLTSGGKDHEGASIAR